MIFLPIIVVFIASVATNEVEVKPCATCIKLNETCYNISYLLTLNVTFRNHVSIPKMGILHRDNILFYSFEPIIEDAEYYKAAFVYLDKPEKEGIITDDHVKILNFGTFGIDQANSIVYLGGSDGIFKYENKKLSAYSSRGDTIKSLFYKDMVYFVDYDGKVIKSKNNDKFNDHLTVEKDRIKTFVMTQNDKIVYLSDKGLFLSNTTDTLLLSHYPFYRGVTVDLDGNIYVWWLNEIYKVIIDSTLAKSRLVKVGTMKENIGVMTFDNNNNIIFNVGRDLYRMTETNITNC